MSLYNNEKRKEYVERIYSRMPSEDATLVRQYLNERVAIEGLSLTRVMKMASTLNVIRKELDKSFTNLEKLDVVGYFSKLESSDYSGWSKSDHRMILRSLLRYLGKDVEYIKIKRPRMRRTDAVLNEDDVIKLIRHACNSRDKALIMMLWESGARIGEIGNLKLRDISFEGYGTRVHLFGKTGQRTILVVASTPYLKNWLKEHPKRDNQDSKLFMMINARKDNPEGRLHHRNVYSMLGKVAKRAGIKKKVNPHWFRHSRATDMAKRWTEAQMKVYLGWTMNSSMPGTYVHMSGRDVDEAVLADRGIQKKQLDEPEREARRTCPHCSYENPLAEIWCTECGAVMDVREIHKAKMKIVDLFAGAYGKKAPREQKKRSGEYGNTKKRKKTADR